MNNSGSLMQNNSQNLLPKVHIQQQLRTFRRIIFLILLLAAGMIVLISIGFMDDEVNGVGTVEGIREYELKTQVTARTIAIFKKSGDFAEAGEKLLELDSRDQQEEIRDLENQIKELELKLSVKENDIKILKKDPLPDYYRHTDLELKEAQERFEQSQKDLETYTKLYEQNAISKHEFVQKEMDHLSKKTTLERIRKDAKIVHTGLANDIVQKAEKELRQMRQQLVSLHDKLKMERRHLDDYVLTAPDAGVVTDIPPRPGNYCTSGETLIKFAANQNKKVIALISESQVYKVQPGQKARISCSQYNYLDYGYFYGEVQYVYQLPVQIGNQKYYPVKLFLISEPYPLRFGSSCQVTIITGRERILFALLGIRSRGYLERKAEGRKRRKAEEKAALTTAAPAQEAANASSDAKASPEPERETKPVRTSK